MKIIIDIVVLLLISCSISAQIKYGFRDNAGRHVIARGFVVNTNDGLGEVFYTGDDYSRMVRMGANYQVIRLELGKLNTLRNEDTIKKYLFKLDSLVALGKNSGIRSVFKMTSYGAKNFKWETLFINKNNEQQQYIKSWKLIWDRYKNEPFVTGYDLVNEPRKEEMQIAYQELSDRYLVPLYRVVIDEANKISATKMYLVQDIFMNKGDHEDHNQYAEIKTSIDRKNIVFTPHIYETKKGQINLNMNRFSKEANLMNAPMFIGEWGFPTFDKTDSTLSDQLKYIDFYVHTTNVFDSMGVGSIKAWFSGNRTKQHFLSDGPSTWAIFEDAKGVGTVERKYITDIIARPYPQSIAGDIQSFKFDFATRSLDLFVNTDNSKGASRIFVGADRHYPDGFSVILNDDFILCSNPLKKTGLEIFKSAATSNPADFIWDESRMQLIILQWPVDKADLHIRIVPGISNN